MRRLRPLSPVGGIEPPTGEYSLSYANVRANEPALRDRLVMLQILDEAHRVAVAAIVVVLRGEVVVVEGQVVRVVAIVRRT